MNLTVYIISIRAIGFIAIKVSHKPRGQLVRSKVNYTKFSLQFCKITINNAANEIDPKSKQKEGISVSIKIRGRLIGRFAEFSTLLVSMELFWIKLDNGGLISLEFEELYLFDAIRTSRKIAHLDIMLEQLFYQNAHPLNKQLVLQY